MIQEVYPNIFTAPISLADSPLKWINCYFIRGTKRNLIIDTAFNTAESWQEMQAIMAELQFTLDNTDVFITHLHVDHCGLSYKMATPNNKVYASQLDGLFMNEMQTPAHASYGDVINDYLGIPTEQRVVNSQHVFVTQMPEGPVAFTTLAPGDTLCVGDFCFQVLDLKGHTPGQIGLYDPKTGICFCGDHVLEHITPNIFTWDLEADYLGYFMQNLKRLQQMKITRLFTAHRELPNNPQERMQELLDHHEGRLQEILGIFEVSSRPLTAYEVAEKMAWSYKRSFQEFPRMQKWFAAGEALAHFQHLYFTGRSARTGTEPLYRFSLPGGEVSQLFPGQDVLETTRGSWGN